MKTALTFYSTWSEVSKSKYFDPATSLLIYDRKLDSVSPEFKKWRKRFDKSYVVRSGESLKDLSRFARHVRSLSNLCKEVSPRDLTVIAVGGGSVGDFAGFFASIFKRGVKLVHVPSTWLASIDSAHGGKTALNVDHVKNQVGSFYPAERVCFIKPLLFAQPKVRVVEANGELGKIALLDGGAWVSKLEKSTLRGADLLWAFLKPAIEAKMKIVARDPFEKTGLRRILNFGHTMGHVFETAYGWPHGAAVAQGLYFALEFGQRRGLLRSGAKETRSALRVRRLLGDVLGLKTESSIRPLAARKAEYLLGFDKKKSASGLVTFIFLKDIGRPVQENLRISEVVSEAKRQGWVKP